MEGELTARVLCVDDDPDLVSSTGTLLEVCGFDVRTATDGDAALAIAREFRPHVCVLDISMKGMNGYDLAERLRRELDTVFLVAVTASYGGEHDESATKAGFARRLIKPADPHMLVGVIAGGTRARGGPSR